ncbi:hypothetical protein F4802DRAFT_388804 [Xylaria palmicola]|nr:hypothetical protein F4802DRAFT_388804 [Xylaria palmicola]
MATAPSHPSANPATTPVAGTVRPSSTGAAPSHSEPPTALAPSFTPAGGVTHGVGNGPIGAPLDGSPGADMRVYPRDGRVRNPVPSKLKNVNEQMKGNFGVMHMDVASPRASEGRDAAAKRTSESTALQAKLAQTDAYVSHQRRANYPRPPGLKQFNPPSKQPDELTMARGPPRPLTVTETKAEQARLLTLLRTLPHDTVVNQICKGLAFFGGVPDAPPPADGKFPESDRANGSGSLFVGWIAEIFPSPNSTFPRHLEDPPPQTTSQKRPRGRPKGSKASKARSDKGLKKGSQKAGKGAGDQSHDPQDDSWVDVEQSALELDDGEALIEAMGALAGGPSTPSANPNDGGITATTPTASSAAGFRSINDGGLAPSSSAKKRGRPKGSKNRPKDKSTAPAAPPPKVTPVPVPVPMLDPKSKNKTNPTKPKSAKSRSKLITEASKDVTVIDTHGQQQQQQQEHEDLTATSDLPSSAQAPASTLDFVDEFTTALNGTIRQNHELYPAAQNSTPALPSPASQVKASTVTAKKRKRPIGNTTTQIENMVSPGGPPSNSQHAQPNSMQATPSTQLQNQSTQPVRQPTPSNAVPPAKRARKPQEPSTTATARRGTPNSISQKVAAPPVSAVAEPAHQSPTDLVAQNQPAAEGLEAHYAAMQSHTDQMQSYNSSRPQHKQQPHAASSMGSTTSPAPVTAPAPAGGLDAHYEHFTALQNMSDSSRQATTARQKQQQPTQTASPIPTQPSKLPQMSATLASQQQTRAPQNYYSQGQGLGSSYNTQQQPSYSTTQRSQQHMSSASPNAGLVQHVTNSPQFSTQSNSPLMQTDNNYRGSPSLIHSNAAFATRRTPTGSPLDTGTYRSNSATNHGVGNHSPHFTARQASAAATTHNTSHSNLSSSFPTFSDSSLFDMNLDSSGNHSSIGISSNSYGLNSSAVPQQQRSSSSNAAPLYSSSGMNNSYLGSGGMGRQGQQNRWGS